MSALNKRVSFGEYVFDILDSVYEPSEDSTLFAENLFVQGGKVLDVGTGCGILGILAAAKADMVVATDVNPYAIDCARHNARLNHVENKMAFVRGDLLTWLRFDAKFDLVLFNSPYLPVEENQNLSWVERAWAGGKTGRVIIDRFISQVCGHVTRNGRVLMLQSTLSDVEETLRAFEETKQVARVIAERSLPFFETIKLIEARPVT